MKFEIDKAILTHRIDELCTKLGISRTTAFEQSGVGKNFISNLTSGSVSIKNLNLLAKYFGVSVEYLVGAETKENFARRVMGEVIEWLEDNDYTYEEQDNSTVAIGKDGKYIYLTFADLMNESLAIKEVSRDGFELAMRDWTRTNFENTQNANNNLTNSINESYNATLIINQGKGDFSKQELELIATYRSLSIREQAEMIQYLLRLQSEESE